MSSARFLVVLPRPPFAPVSAVLDTVRIDGRDAMLEKFASMRLPRRALASMFGLRSWLCGRERTWLSGRDLRRSLANVFESSG